MRAVMSRLSVGATSTPVLEARDSGVERLRREGARSFTKGRSRGIDTRDEKVLPIGLLAVDTKPAPVLALSRTT